jgi:hypothetical protein
MADAEDAHGVVFQSEQYTVISEAKPERASHIAVQRSYVARASACKTENALKGAWRLASKRLSMSPIIAVIRPD